ncbi:glycosyltransferase family 8 protein [Helicobacter sp. 23-1045]
MHNDLSARNQQMLKDTIAEFGGFASLEFIDMDGRFCDEWGKLGLQAHFAKEFFYKLLLTSHFEFEKIIISDVDVVFLGDVSESFLAFKGDDYLAGVKANNPNAIYPLDGWKKGYRNFSDEEFLAVKNGVGGGYLIANLKAWRADDIEAKLVNYLKENAKKLVLAEQDVLNIICYPRIATLSPAHIVCHANWEVYGDNWEKLVPEIYSQKELDSARLRPIQLHFVGEKKPWNDASVPKSEIWFLYMLKTPFAREFLESLEGKIIEKHKKTLLLNRIRNKIKRIFRRIFAKRRI